jgi:diguanylate cyclase (GGDEF)-like protein
LVALSTGTWIDARRTQSELPAIQQGLELLRLEREVGVSVGRLGLEAVRAGYGRASFEDLPGARADVALTLQEIRGRLRAMEPLPAWQTTVERLRETLDEGIRRMEADVPPPEGLWAWQWAFTTSFSGVFPGDLTGRWSHLLEFAIGTQYGVYVPMSFAELVLAHWAESGGPVAAHEGLRAYLDGEAARLASLRDENDGKTPFEPEFDVAAARDLGPDMAFAVAGVRAAPPVRRLEEGHAWLVGQDRQQWVPRSADELFAATSASLTMMSRSSDELLVLAEDQLRRAAAQARVRGRIAVFGGLLVALAGLGVLGWWMTVRGRLETRLRAAAERDTLTGVGSRFSLFEDEEPRLLRPDAGSSALLLTDMDDFKSINDRWGHSVGDAALICFAQACAAVVGPDDRVTRIGGDEFVLVLHGLTDPGIQAATVAERLHANLSEPVEIEGVRLHLRATIGIAVANGPMHIDELLLQADTALLDAKKNRRNRHAIYSRNYRRSLIREIDGALARGEIQPVFQPIVHAHSGRVSGAELLARWTREDGSQVPLDALIEAMLSVGASGVWTERMLDAAAQVAPVLPDDDVRFWLNVAMPDLVGPGAQTLIDTLAAGPVVAGRLGVEVTERIPPADLPEARSTLLTLRAAGLAAALDDVGSDGVPLRHLTELPLDRVKIDGALVRGVEVSSENRALLRGIVTVADDLQLEIVAEQVETEGEAQVLRDLGVQHLQGYRTGAPVEMETFIRALRSEQELSSAPLTRGRALGSRRSRAGL